MRKVLAAVLALVLVLSLTACGSGESLVGSWKLTGFTEDGKDLLASENVSLPVLEEKGLYFGIEAKSDKTAVMKFIGEEEQLTWDDKNITTDGVATPYEIKNNILTMSYDSEGKKQVMTFKRMTDEEAKKFANITAEDLQKAILEMAMEVFMKEAE